MPPGLNNFISILHRRPREEKYLTILIDGIRCHADRPPSCRQCYFWKNRKVGCSLGEQNCYYLAQSPEKKSPCEDCCYGPCISFCMEKIRGSTEVPAKPGVLEKYYQQLLKTKAVPKSNCAKPQNEFVSTSTIRDVHKLLRNCFGQAVKWEFMEKNLALNATVPKYKPEKRDI